MKLINLVLTWSANYIISNATGDQATNFAITDTKLDVLVVTLSNDDNVKQLKQLKSGFELTLNWNKYETKTITQNVPNQYFDFWIKPSFQRVNRLFVWIFNASDSRIGHSRSLLPTAIGEDYSVMIDGRNVFDQPVKNHIKTLKHSKNYDQSKGWLHNCLFAKLQLFKNNKKNTST